MPTKNTELLSHELLAELERVMADVTKGKRNPVAMKKAARDMDKMREQTREEFGILDVAAKLVREGREEA